MVSLTAIFLGALGFAIFYYFRKEKARKPPGPRGIPIFGSLFSLDKSPHITFKKWANEYGPIVYAKLGTTPVVILDDAKLVREAFNNPVFSGRPDLPPFHLLSDGKHGVLNAEGQEWVDQRRYVLRNLRDFGFGKKTMENLIYEEVSDVLSWLKKSEGKPISVNNKFQLAVVNALWYIMSGKRYAHDDVKQTTILDDANETFNKELANKGYLLFFPELTQLAIMFPKLSGWAKLVKVAAPMKQIFEDIVVEHEQNPADENSPRDFVDVYRNEIKNTTDTTSSFYKDQGRRSLVTVLGDLYGAGSGTTSITLTFAILYLITHPKVQSKLQAEIDDVIGKSRMPTLADKAKTPYVDAVIQEILRFSSITPTGLFHTAMADTTFHGYDIKKGTMIIANLFSVHRDPESWGDPENFRPERFLSPDGKTVIRNESSMSFSVGKRQCPGESLARDQLYLFLTSMFQRFTAHQDPANPNPTLEPKEGLFREPQKYTVVFKDRQ